MNKDWAVRLFKYRALSFYHLKKFLQHFKWMDGGKTQEDA